MQECMKDNWKLIPQVGVTSRTQGSLVMKKTRLTDRPFGYCYGY